MENIHTKPKLIMFSGPPGVGKSSLSYRLARETGIAILTKDQIERTLITSKLARDTGRLAYDLLIEICEFNLQRGASLILDAVFGTNNLRNLFIRQAAGNDAEFYGIDCICSDKTLWQNRLAARPEMVPGWQPANWADSVRVQGYYEEWAYPHLTLDAVNSFESNYRKLLAYLGQ